MRYKVNGGLKMNINKNTSNEIKKSAHSTYRCQYHIVFAPKYRRKEIYGQLKKDIGEIMVNPKALKKYKPFFKAGLMSFTAYRFNLFMWFFISVLQVACALFLWICIYNQNGSQPIEGFTFKEMIVYLVFINTLTFAFGGSDTMFEINENFKDGTIALQLTKPISYRIKFIFMALGGFVGVVSLLVAPIIVISFTLFAIFGFISLSYLTPVYILLSILGLIFAVLVFDAINFFFGQLCFYTQSAWGLNECKNAVSTFLAGGIIPIAFFPPGLREVAMYLPFASMGSSPVLVLMGKASLNTAIHYVGLALSWWIILEIFNAIIFKRATKRLVVQGG